MTDQAFIEKLSEGVGRIQLARQRSSSLPPGEAAAQIKRIEEENGTKKSKIAEEVRRKKEEARAKERRQEKEKEKVMSHGEKELWESGDWRDHVKDLNASFSKLPPKERRQEEEKEKVMSHGEKELWESGDWRDHVKDLNASFSKLPPICKGKKKRGRGEAFTVE